MIKAVLVTFGYAESCIPASVAFIPEQFYSNKFDALRSLAVGLFKKYLNTLDSYEKNKCCKTATKKNKYCAKCGSILATNPSVEDFKVWLLNTTTFTYDHWGYDEDFGWSIYSPSILFDLKKKDILILDEFAENTLVYALNEDDHLSEEWSEEIKDNWVNYARFHEIELDECLDFFKKQLKADSLSCI